MEEVSSTAVEEEMDSEEELTIPSGKTLIWSF